MKPMNPPIRRAVASETSIFETRRSAQRMVHLLIGNMILDEMKDTTKKRELIMFSMKLLFETLRIEPSTNPTEELNHKE